MCSRRPSRKALVLWLMLAALSWVEPSPAGDGPWQPVVAALHVHSTVSTGDMTLEQLAERAEQLGLDALILSENLALRYEYGLFPVRQLLRYSVSFPSVVEHGIPRFLEDVAAVQARHPRVLLIPGIEAGPHYYWTGTPLGRDLVMHDSQKNILMFGPLHAADFARLPANGNPAAGVYDWSTVAMLLPAGLLVPAAWLWRRRTVRTVRVGVVTYQAPPKRYRAEAGALAVVAGLLVFAAWPPAQPPFSPYDALGIRPYQRFLDTAQARGAVTVWSMPEAEDHHEYAVGPLPVTVDTRPYPHALLESTGYTAFGGVYQDNRTVIQPGGIWDTTLSQYLAGQRREPVYAVGEIAFHSLAHAGKDLDQVLTVFWAREKTVPALLEAARVGRYYAAAQARAYGLRLENFRVDCGDGCAAGSGETVRPAPGTERTITIAISATDLGSHPIVVSLIRSGTILSRQAGSTPFVRHITDPDSADPAYYRVAVEGDGEILSNPIFVRPQTSGAAGRKDG